MATVTRNIAAIPNFNDWNAQTQWVGAVVVNGDVRVTNADDTITAFVGTGLTLDGSGIPTSGTITSVNLLTSGGILLETIAGISRAFVGANVEMNTRNAIAALLSGSDTLTGSLGNDILFGYDGADIFDGGGSFTSSPADIYVGGRGADIFNFTGDANTVTLNYAIEGGPSSVTVNLAAGTITDTYGFVDTFAANSAFKIVMTNGADSFVGGSGNDFVQAGGGVDTMNGGGGKDTLDYAGDFGRGGTAAVGVYLSSNVAIDGYGNFEPITNFENVIGTDVNNSGYNDIIFGNTLGNYIDARAGGDIVVAGDGADHVYGGFGTDAIYGGEGDDILVGSDSNFIAGATGELDYLIAEGGNDTLYTGLIGTSYSDGGAGNDTIFGGSGTDYVLSGTGSDTVALYPGLDLVVLHATELTAGDVDTYVDFTDGQDFIYMTASLSDATSFGNGVGYAYMAISVASGTHFTIFSGVTAAQITDQIFFNL